MNSNAISAMHPVRRAVLRGLAIILPPLLTIVVFLWAWNMIDTYILIPCERLAGRVIVWSIKDIKSGIPEGADKYRDPRDPSGPVIKFDYNDRTYVQIGRSDKWIPESVRAIVDANPSDDSPAPSTAYAYYDRYVHVEYLRRGRTVPLFLALFLLVLYLTGKFMAAGVGNFVWGVGESIVHRTPIVRNVYSAVKQITDYIFQEQEVKFTRVVAVEYPRKGLWTISFVTGEGFKDVYESAGEPILSVLIPTSPMPATGFTCIVLKRDTVDLDITVDQALQYIVSCGVVVPRHQQWTSPLPEDVSDEIGRQIREDAAQAQRLAQSA